MLSPLFSFKTYKVVRSICFWPCLSLGVCLSFVGIYFSLFASPLDYQQKETVRIMYVHVPSSWLALGIYAFMGLASIGGFVWRHSLGFLYARAAWPIGFIMCCISLLTGAIWGKPMWGTWWVWDARLTSMFVLLLMYLGYGLFMSSQSSGQQHSHDTYRRGALFLCIGLVNLPVIKYSVEWWSTLHQPASLIREGGIAIASEMLVPLFISFGGFLLLCLGLGFLRVDTLVMRYKNYRRTYQDSRMVYVQQTGEAR